MRARLGGHDPAGEKDGEDHEKDEDRAAFLDADLGRLVFGYNQAVGEEKNQRYKDALKKWVDRWGDHEISARARYHWGSCPVAEEVSRHCVALPTMLTKADLDWVVAVASRYLDIVRIG
ncbi:MAG: hypothetical protein K6U03_01605 [Firmicutes bacterium]|nr:hypothetical protein [Bacillota bacterium]